MTSRCLKPLKKFWTPLFTGDSPEGNKGNAQDERMKLRNSSSAAATERGEFIMHLENY
jgi:hypothetical protein